jgi:hypothetical protein
VRQQAKLQLMEDRHAIAGEALHEPLVGIGTMCRRQSSAEVERIMRTFAARELNLHGFGVKITGLDRYAEALSSSDSMFLYPVGSCWWMLIFTLPLMRTAYAAWWLGCVPV